MATDFKETWRKMLDEGASADYLFNQKIPAEALRELSALLRERAHIPFWEGGSATTAPDYSEPRFAWEDRINRESARDRDWMKEAGERVMRGFAAGIKPDDGSQDVILQPCIECDTWYPISVGARSDISDPAARFARRGCICDECWTKGGYLLGR